MSIGTLNTSIWHKHVINGVSVSFFNYCDETKVTVSFCYQTFSEWRGTDLGSQKLSIAQFGLSCIHLAKGIVPFEPYVHARNRAVQNESFPFWRAPTASKNISK